jgi:ABC-type metal ion transport system, periplasmic component/surface adhesin
MTKNRFAQRCFMLVMLLSGLLYSFKAQAQATTRALNVVVTFSILADVVQNIGGDRLQVHSIVGPNQDAHVFEPTPETGQLIMQADIVFLNGLGFETWLERLVQASGYQGPLIFSSQGIEAHQMIDPTLSADPVPDPHVWNDVRNVLIWVENIKTALQKLDPDHEATYEHNARAYAQELQGLDQWIKQTLATIPQHACKVITAHDAFNYFERAYKIIFLAPSGLSTEDQPSAFEMADLIQQIRREGIKTIFIENIATTHLIKQIAEETGATIGGVLYSDALSLPQEPGSTYIKMMQSNVTTLTKGLTCAQNRPRT